VKGLITIYKQVCDYNFNIYKCCRCDQKVQLTIRTEMLKCLKTTVLPSHSGMHFWSHYWEADAGGIA
jgi:hypothetical protein